MDKLFARMSDNPRSDWTISDVEAVCRNAGVTCAAERRKLALQGRASLAVRYSDDPLPRPIKPIYIRKLIAFIDAVRSTP